MNSNPSRPKPLANGLLGSLFLVALFVPGINMLLRTGAPPTQKIEFREPANLPTVPESLADLGAFPSAFTDYFRDRFGLREQLLKLNNRLKWSVLSESPTSMLVRGKDEWVFYAFNQTIETWRGANPFLEGELEAQRQLIESRRDWLADQGIDYMYVIVPDKSAVYPELLPNQVDKVGPSRREQLFAYMAKNSDVLMLDLTEAMLAETKFDQGDDFVYNKFGTHWTERGGLAGYRRIMQELGSKWPAMVARPRDSFAVGPGKDHAADSWSSRMYLSGVLQESFYSYHSKTPAKMRADKSVQLPLRGAAFSVDDLQLPRLLLLHDSFGPTLRPYLGEHFASFWSLWRGVFDKESILRHGPEMVVELRVERALVGRGVRPDAELSDAAKHRLGMLPKGGSLLNLDLYSSGPKLTDLIGQGEVRLSLLEGPDGGMRISTSSSTDIVLLPEFKFTGSGPWLVRMDISSYVNTDLGILFQTKAEPSFHRDRLVTARLKTGTNLVILELTDPTMLGKLALHLGTEPGDFLLKHLDVRSGE